MKWVLDAGGNKLGCGTISNQRCTCSLEKARLQHHSGCSTIVGVWAAGGLGCSTIVGVWAAAP